MLENSQRAKPEEEIGPQLREAAQQVEPAFSEERHRRIMQIIDPHSTKPSVRSTMPRQRRRMQRRHFAGMAGLVALCVAMFFGFSPFTTGHTDRPADLTSSPQAKTVTNQLSTTKPPKPALSDGQFRVSDGIQLVFDLLHAPVQPVLVRQPSLPDAPQKQTAEKSAKPTEAKNEVVLLNRFAGNWTVRLTP